MTKYRNHDTRMVLRSEQYGAHMLAMTAEALHGKSEIAEELAARDLELARMRNRIECLRGGLKSACGWFNDLDDQEHADLCMEMAGDMEPPLMGSNDRVEGRDACGASLSHAGLCPGESSENGK